MTTSNSYEKIVNIVSKSAKLVAEETINGAAEELKGENVDNIVDVGVSCDGSWHWRGYSSLSGVIFFLRKFNHASVF